MEKSDKSGMIVLKSDLQIQTRRAQNLAIPMAAAIRTFCEANQEISACYVLDGRRPDTGAIALIIAVTLSGGDAKLATVAPAFMTMLANFPDYAEHTFLQSSEPFASTYAGFEFYARSA